MKNLHKYAFAAAAWLTLALSGCSADDFPTPSAAGIPKAADYEQQVEVTVDQATNQVTFNLNAPGVMPVWIFDGKEYSTRNGLQKVYASSGQYEVEVKILNSNGMSDGSIIKTFNVDNTIFDFGKYFTLLEGDGTRQWRVDNDSPAHLGCGPSGTDGTEWWAAQPNEKEAEGLYGNRIAFDRNYNYTFTAGDAGTIYVNKEVSRYDGHNGTDEVDYNVDVEDATATYAFEVVGPDLFITLPKGTNFPYIPNNDFYDAPRLKVASISAKSLELIADNGGIAWHYIFTSGAGVTKFNGYKYDSEFNLWKSATKEEPTFWYAPGWSQIADPAYTNADGKEYTVTLPEATTETWQAQMHIVTDIALNAATNYDFSVILTTSQPHGNITLKLTDTTDDGNFLFAETAKTAAYEDCIFYLSDVPGIDAAAVKMVFDFGGNAAGTEVTIKNIVIKDHANDDGTVLPADEPDVPGGDVTWNEDAPANLWRGCDYYMFYYYAPGWAQIADPELVEKDYTYSFTLPEATDSQWQAQVAFKTDITTNAATNYDFKCVLNSSQDIKGVTVKLVMDGDDGVFYFADRVDLTAYEDFVYTNVNMPGIDMERVNLFFDFGGNPANTDIVISGIVLQEHSGPAVFDPNAGTELWRNDFGLTWWYAPGWNQIADPAVSGPEGTYTFTLPEATDQRWQAQMVFHTDIVTEEDAVYDFHCVINSSAAFQTMFKLTQEDNDEIFYFADEELLPEYEDFVFERLGLTGKQITNIKLVLDYGGCPAGTEISLSDIHLIRR